MTEESGKRKAESGVRWRLALRFRLSAFRFSPQARRGFSLLEVLLASGILLGCLIVLSELASIGRRHVRDAEDLITAERICQTKINEFLAGLQEPVAVEYAEVEDEPGWFYSVETEPVRQRGLIAVRVTVVRDVAEAGGEAFAPAAGQAQQFTLVRWVRDPEAPRGLGDLDSWDSFLFTPALGGRR